MWERVMGILRALDRSVRTWVNDFVYEVVGVCRDYGLGKIAVGVVVFNVVLYLALVFSGRAL